MMNETRNRSTKDPTDLELGVERFGGTPLFPAPGAVQRKAAA
jgi:hypothetical protein